MSDKKIIDSDSLKLFGQLQDKRMNDKDKAIKDELEAAINAKSDENHDHDDKYYTESEIDVKLDAKSDKTHTHTATDVGARPSDWKPSWDDVTDKPSTFAPTLGTTSTTAFRGDYGNTAYTHSQAEHAPSNAQKNSDITKAEIEAKLTGAITSHNHDGQYYTEAEIDTKLSEVNANITNITNNAKTYTDNQITALVNGAPEAMNTLNELSSAITEHQDVYEAYVADMTSKLAGKSDTTHTHTAADVGARPSDWKPSWNDVTDKPTTFAPTLGTTSTTAFRGDYGNTAYTHSQAAHAPSNAQKNSDITKAEIEAKLTGAITSHNHDGQYYTEAEIDTKLSEKADSEHGVHVSYSTTAPKANGTASAGSAETVARTDHVHPLQTTVSGNAGSATKLQNARTLTIGNKGFTFDGTADRTWTLSDIGAAATSHTHKSVMYEDLSGKTVSLNDYNLSAGTPHIAYYYCPSDGNGANITGRPNDSSKQAFNLKVELIRYASSTDYITMQTYIQGSQKRHYIRYCTNGTWTSWESVYTSAQKPAWGDITGKPSTFAPTLGTTSTTAFRGDYGNTAYTHSQAAHAPSNAQKNSDITKAEIEAKLTGDITSHIHTVLSLKADNFKYNSALPDTYDRGMTMFFSNTPPENEFFNGLQYATIQTIKGFGSGSAATQWLYPYNTNTNSVFIRHARYNNNTWGAWGKVYTSVDKPTPTEIGAAAASSSISLSVENGELYVEY